jgi:diguanylate cyclase (GGDEF)-like protein
MRIKLPRFVALDRQVIALRQPRAKWAPDGLAGGAEPSPLRRGAPRGRGGADARLANAVIAHLPLAIAVIDAKSRLSFWNEQAAILFGVPPLMAATAPHLSDMLTKVAGLTPGQRDQIAEFCATHIAAGDRTEPESWLRVSRGRNSRLTIQVRGIGMHRWMLVIDNGTMASGRAGAMQGGGDASLDPLTGLSNRRHFNQVLRTLVDEATTESKHSLLMIGLDQFKPINETLGRPAGDALLCLVGQRLRRETREEDLLVRLGGDQFVILPANAESAEALAKRVVDILSRPFKVEGQIAHIGASVGIAHFPSHGPSADELTRHAELALQAAKAAGGRTWRLHEPTMAVESHATRDLENTKPE